MNRDSLRLFDEFGGSVTRWLSHRESARNSVPEHGPHQTSPKLQQEVKLAVGLLRKPAFVEGASGVVFGERSE